LAELMPNTLTVSGGNISAYDADRLRAPCRFPVPDWEPGSTEPWIIDCVAALLRASGQQNVLELGGYKGAMSAALAETLQPIGGLLVVVEINPTLAADTLDRLNATATPKVEKVVLIQDALDAIRALPDRSIGLCWVDDEHDSKHVVEEVTALIPKIQDNGLICFHDVCGMYRLWAVVKHWGGYSLNLARVSNSGGLGLLQVKPSTRRIEPPTIEWQYPVGAGTHHGRDDISHINVLGNMEVPD
jgi:hypothetical protein